jgi:hypothetical protein
MSVSRNKNSLMINEIASELALKYPVSYLFSDFKKDNGNLKINELVKQYEIYRQNYCGCIYSLKKLENCDLAFLPNRDIFFYQSTEMFRMNTDTKLLGESLVVSDGDDRWGDNWWNDDCIVRNIAGNDDGLNWSERDGNLGVYLRAWNKLSMCRC